MEQRPADRREQHGASQNAVDERRIRKEVFELSDAGSECQKHQRTDRRNTHALDGAQQLESPREAVQKPRQILIFFLSHGAKISVILSPLIRVVYARGASSAKWQERIACAMQTG